MWSSHGASSLLIVEFPGQRWPPSITVPRVLPQSNWHKESPDAAKPLQHLHFLAPGIPVVVGGPPAWLISIPVIVVSLRRRLPIGSGCWPRGRVSMACIFLGSYVRGLAADGRGKRGVDWKWIHLSAVHRTAVPASLVDIGSDSQPTHSRNRSLSGHGRHGGQAFSIALFSWNRRPSIWCSRSAVRSA